MLQLNFVISLENNTKQHRNECRETKLESNAVMYKDAVRYTNPARVLWLKVKKVIWNMQLSMKTV